MPQPYLAAAQDPEPAPGETPHPAVVRIVNQHSQISFQGSGTLVDKNDRHGLILSCAHTFEKGVGSVTVTFPDGQAYAAKLLEVDQANDLSVLLIKTPAQSPVEVAQRGTATWRANQLGRLRSRGLSHESWRGSEVPFPKRRRVGRAGNQRTFAPWRFGRPDVQRIG